MPLCHCWHELLLLLLHLVQARLHLIGELRLGLYLPVITIEAEIRHATCPVCGSICHLDKRVQLWEL